MKKSSSHQTFKMYFNPSEFQVGQSKIDKLPVKLGARRHSACILPRHIPTQISQLQSLRSQNSQLRNQNQQLKAQLEVMRTREKKGIMVRTQGKVNQYRDIIINKLNSKTKTSRMSAQCETGLFSSKQVSIEKSDVTITQWYQTYKNQNKLPPLKHLQEVADIFFKNYCDHYSKIKSMFQCLQVDQNKQAYKNLSQLLELYHLPLAYQKTPQTLFRELSRQKKSQSRVSKDTNRDEIAWQTLSPKQTAAQFESLVMKVCNSTSIIRFLKGSQPVMKFLSKLQSQL